MATACTCLACQLQRKADTMDEDIDNLVACVADAEARRGSEDATVRFGWETIHHLVEEQRHLYAEAKMAERELRDLERQTHPRRVARGA